MHTLFWLRTDRARTTIPPWPPPRDGTVTALFLSARTMETAWRRAAKVDFWLRNLHALSGDLQASASPEAVR